mgnify:CR=1 FL=1
MEDGPFYDAVRANHENVIKQEFVTYFKNKEGNLEKSVAVRNFFSEDYVDHSSKEIFALSK